MKTMQSFLILFIFVVSCAVENQHKSQPLTTEEKEIRAEVITALENEFHQANLAFDSQTKILAYPHKIYTITIPRGASLSLLGKHAYSDLQVFEEQFNLGGIKLSYEISADLNRIEDANTIKSGDNFTFYSLGALGFKLRDLTESSNGLPARIIREQVTVLEGRVK